MNPTSGAMAMTKTVRWQRMERNGGVPNSLEQQAKLVDLISQVVEKKDSLSVLFDALTSVEAFNKIKVYVRLPPYSILRCHCYTC